MNAPFQDVPRVTTITSADLAALRAENARLRAEPIHALRTDIERLRMSLEAIAVGLTDSPLDGGLTKAEAVAIARAALAAKVAE